ncbi:MAG: hypothetical protein IJ088_16235 [Clostridia bacterium]|nr:hypothetical protein [Clostridia bacterium]
MQLDENGLRVLVRWLLEQLGGKVDTVPGMGLSENSLTDADRLILDGQYEGAVPGLVPDGRTAEPETFLRADGSWAPAGVQSDWEEQASDSPAFIQNRPFGRTRFTVIPLQTVVTDTGGQALPEGDASLVPEDGELLAEFDDIQYTLVLEPEYDSSGILICIRAGNRYFETGQRADNTGEPFCLIFSGSDIRLLTDAGKTHRIMAEAEIRRQLDAEWVGDAMDPITDTEIERLFAEAADQA